MIALNQTVDGVTLPVRVRAAARDSELRGEHDGMLKVAIRQAPEKGKANLAIIVLLANQLGYRKPEIELISGATKPCKVFLIHGATIAELTRRLEPLH